jgi:hypothetical protein
VVKEKLHLERSDDGPSPSDPGNLDISDDDMYVDDHGASLPNDTECDDTDCDGDRQPGRGTNTNTDSETLDTDGNEERQLDE